MAQPIDALRAVERRRLAEIRTLVEEGDQPLATDPLLNEALGIAEALAADLASVVERSGWTLDQLAGERGAHVLRLRFLHRRSYSAIGRDQGVSKQRAVELVSEATARLIARLEQRS